MEVLFITHKYPPSVGGMEKQSFEIIEYFKRQNHKVHCLIYDNKEGKVKFFRRIGREVKAVLKANPNIQLIHLNDALMASVTLLFKSGINVPMVATVHGLDIVFPPAWFQKKIVPRLHKLNGVIAVSNATKNECIKRGFDKEKVTVVLNGVDHSIADIAIDKGYKQKFEEQHNINLNNKKLLVLMGRPVKRKGFSWFLTQVLPKLDEDVMVVIIGDVTNNEPTPSQKMLQKLMPRGIQNQIDLMFGASTDNKLVLAALENTEISKRVIITGKIPFTDLIQTLSLASIFIMPNLKVAGDMEGFGLVALEASLRALPVLASGIEGITDAVNDGGNGYLLPSDDVTAWQEKITELLANTNALEAFGEQTKDYTLNTYSWEKMGAEYKAYFETVIKNNKA